MLCDIHKVEMQERWRKDDPNHTGESFYSHKQGDGWCNGKEKRANPLDEILETLRWLKKNHPAYQPPKKEPEGTPPF